jgi:hypothetical protein
MHNIKYFFSIKLIRQSEREGRQITKKHYFLKSYGSAPASDIRTQGYNISTVFYVLPRNKFMTEKQWSVNAYSQKMYMHFSKNVTVKQLSGPQKAPLHS